jgi:hypothetical protein
MSLNRIEVSLPGGSYVRGARQRNQIQSRYFVREGDRRAGQHMDEENILARDRGRHLERRSLKNQVQHLHSALVLLNEQLDAIVEQLGMLKVDADIPPVTACEGGPCACSAPAYTTAYRPNVPMVGATCGGDRSGAFHRPIS